MCLKLQLVDQGDFYINMHQMKTFRFKLHPILTNIYNKIANKKIKIEKENKYYQELVLNKAINRKLLIGIEITY
jgi:hypothetical protein